MENLRKSSGVTLMVLITTIIIMLILAGVTIRAITTDNGVIDEAKNAKEATERSDIEEQIQVATLQALGKYDEVTLTEITQQLIDNKVITDASQVDKTTGAITVDGYVFEGMLDDYLASKIYYGASTIVPTDTNYFTFEINEDGKTATITGIKDDYAEKYYYEDIEYIAAIKYNDTYITDVVIPYEVTSTEGKTYKVNKIGKNAFSLGIYDNYNSDLEVEANAYFTSFVFPNTIKSIETGAFLGCKKLNNVVIPDSVTNIGAVAFHNCPSLSSVIIGNSVTSIGDQAFSYCTSLSSVIIGNSVTSIGGQAFYYCTSLSSINIPDSVTSIGVQAFYGWTSSQTINCEAASAPSGWNSRWKDSCNATINWGVSM